MLAARQGGSRLRPGMSARHSIAVPTPFLGRNNRLPSRPSARPSDSPHVLHAAVGGVVVQPGNDACVWGKGRRVC